MRSSKYWINHPMRLLDIQDFYILSMLSEGCTQRTIGHILNIHPAAIVYRKKKYKEIWPEFKYEKNGKRYSINEAAMTICRKASEALKSLD